MTHTLLYCLVFIITLLILVTIHEWGHFWVAKCLNVKVLQFSFGFGKPLWRHKGKDGVEYLFSWLPLGGYVRLLDGREGKVADAEKHLAFDLQPVWKRIAILFAGPFMNLVLAYMVFLCVFLVGIQKVVPVVGEVLPFSIAASAHLPVGVEIKQVNHQITDSWQKVVMSTITKLGDTDSLVLSVRQPDTSALQDYHLPLTNWSVDSLEPDPLKSLGIVPYHPFMPAVIGFIKADSPAVKAGLQTGDRVVAINGRTIQDWLDLIEYVKTLPGQTVPITLERAGTRITTTITLAKELAGLHWEGKMGVGVNPPIWPADKRYLFKLPSFLAAKAAGIEVADLIKFHAVLFKKLLSGKISLLSMGGPITIFETSNMAFQQGVAVYIGFLGLLSVILACMNLLPIPGLDGGQILFCLIELVTRRAIAWRWQQLLLRLGMICLVLLIVQATVNDIIRLF